MNDLIRSAIAAEAEERVDSRTVLAELHKAKKRRKPLGLIIGVASLTAAAAAAAVIIPTAVKKTDASPATNPPATVTAQNVLLLGLDSYGFTDTIVYARFETDGSVSAVSLPRDVWTGGAGGQKINHLFQEDPAKLTDAVEKMTGTKVDHYAAVKMSELGKVADAVGGVEICLTAPAKDQFSGVDLPAGRSTVKGEQALAFLRQRYGLRNGDLDRIKRHQAFLTALAAKITKENALPVAREIGRTIHVDQGWDVLEFAQRFRGPVKIRTATLPVGPEEITSTGAGFVVDQAQAKQFVEKQFGGGAPAEPGCVS
ncbi:LCP family protein [Lentzea flava]|uniref:LytTR family transcriptional regulator n=1 Tax=Lentzea flava TaxID=103732 RepID=A0ABQ2UTW4_9PSEU|nr:LCP family protein [Lentzea flava]MCP2201400.1 transcriptional attenuator, LytR family [Lentzea flava]GGU51320.1 LytTR family transcriptional regulator [Lentzea flava]